MSAGLRCTLCGAAPEDAGAWRCSCGGPFYLAFAGEAPLESVEPERAGLWRYRRALPPLPPGEIITLGEGMTPLVPARLEGRDLLLKCDFCNPTGSWKDRGWTVAVSHLRSRGVARVVEDSSGNAGASLAAYGARAGMEVTVFVPHDSPAMKRRQIEAYGAQVVRVEGGRDAVASACLEAAHDRFYAGHAWNPHFLAGPRTLAWELVEQMGGQAPAAVCVPVGQGGLLLGLAHGFADLVAAGSLDRAPRLVAVQSAAFAPLVEGWRRLAGTAPGPGAAPGAPELAAMVAAGPPAVRGGDTLADAIRTPRPVRYGEVLAALAASRGVAVAVEDDVISRAGHALGRAGFDAEPTSAAAAAGALLALAEGSLHAGDGPVVVVLTGHGLKGAA